MVERTKSVETLMDRYGALRWCEPDAEMEQQSPAAVRWLEEQLDAMHGVATPSGDSARVGLRVVRSQRELLRRFRAGLSGTREAGSVALFRDAVKRLAPGTHAHSSELQERVAALIAAQRNTAASLRSLGALPAPSPEAGGPELVVRGCSAAPGVGPLQLHAEWVARFDLDEPSPWEPFVALFERGTWPVLLANELLVWVPVRARGAIEDPSPVKPVWPITRPPPGTVEQWLDASEATARTVGIGAERDALLAYLEAGLAIPPCAFALSPLRNPADAFPMPCLSPVRPAACLSVAAPPNVDRAKGPGVETREGVIDRFKRWLKGERPDGES